MYVQSLLYITSCLCINSRTIFKIKNFYNKIVLKLVFIRYFHCVSRKTNKNKLQKLIIIKLPQKKYVYKSNNLTNLILKIIINQ